MDKLQQYTRSNNIIINGIPENPDENVFTIIEKVVESLSCKISKSDIDTCHRLRPYRNDSSLAKNQKPIIVKLTSRLKKNEILGAACMKKRLTTEELGFENTNQKIYLNEHLTPKRQSICDNIRKLDTSRKLKIINIVG